MTLPSRTSSTALAPASTTIWRSASASTAYGFELRSPLTLSRFCFHSTASILATAERLPPLTSKRRPACAADGLREALDLLRRTRGHDGVDLAVGSHGDAVRARGEDAARAAGRDEALGDGLLGAVRDADDLAGGAEAHAGLALALALTAGLAGVRDVDGAVGADGHAARVVEPARDGLDRLSECSWGGGQRGGRSGYKPGGSPPRGLVETRIHVVLSGEPHPSVGSWDGNPATLEQDSRFRHFQRLAGSIRLVSATGLSVRCSRSPMST